MIAWKKKNNEKDWEQKIGVSHLLFTYYQCLQAFLIVAAG